MVFNRLNIFNIYNETDEDLKDEIAYLKKILKHALKYKKIKKATFSVIIVTNEEIHKINKVYRNIDRPTDVISFALEDEKREIPSGRRLLGDIYISIDQARIQKESYGHSLYRELSFLAVHGLLHLLGYDHQTKEEEKIMFKEQELILDEEKFKELRR